MLLTVSYFCLVPAVSRQMRLAVALSGVWGLGLLSPVVAAEAGPLQPTYFEQIAKLSDYVVQQSIAAETRGRGLLSRLSRQLVTRPSDGECSLYLYGQLASQLANCTAMNQAIRNLTSLDTTKCQTTYNIEQTFLQSRICSSSCYKPMLDTLSQMSKSGCMAQSAFAALCRDCGKGTTCVGGQCLPSCTTDADCKCNGKCTSGGCLTQEQASNNMANMGVWGLRASMEQLCFRPSAKKDYCAAQLSTALNAPGLSLVNLCSRLSGVGCCAATNIQFGMKCAMTGDVIVTPQGNYTLDDLESTCPLQDFRTPCSGAPSIPTVGASFPHPTHTLPHRTLKVL